MHQNKDLTVLVLPTIKIFICWNKQVLKNLKYNIYISTRNDKYLIALWVIKRSKFNKSISTVKEFLFL